jgi:DNA polymerase I-like protein with 3'-5' exonuclease and polymerase domains
VTKQSLLKQTQTATLSPGISSVLHERKLLNVRRMFIPDPGHVIVDADLQGADAFVFAWQCGDGKLKTYMKTGTKMHVESNKFLFPDLCWDDGSREPYYTEVKSAAHGTNYGAGVSTLSANLGWPRHRVVRFQDWWHARFPEIKAHHRRTETVLQTTREVRNPYGLRIHFFGDIRQSLPEALAWVPQSTVAVVCRRGALGLRRRFPPSAVRILLQVHDSLVFQLPYKRRRELLPQIRMELNKLIVPFPDEPLRIPWNFKWSLRSWGDCHSVNWEKLEPPT